MSDHHCHALGCKTACPPAMLMCIACWRLVSPPLQREVYRTVKMRGRFIDETWAPWWRASHRAIVEVATKDGHDGERLDRYLTQAMTFADELERDA